MPQQVYDFEQLIRQFNDNDFNWFRNMGLNFSNDAYRLALEERHVAIEEPKTEMYINLIQSFQSNGYSNQRIYRELIKHYEERYNFRKRVLQKFPREHTDVQLHPAVTNFFSSVLNMIEYHDIDFLVYSMRTVPDEMWNIMRTTNSLNHIKVQTIKNGHRQGVYLARITIYPGNDDLYRDFMQICSTFAMGPYWDTDPINDVTSMPTFPDDVAFFTWNRSVLLDSDYEL